MTRLERRTHQALVDALLAELADGRREWYRLQVAGVRPAGARAVRAEQHRTQARLQAHLDH